MRRLIKNGRARNQFEEKHFPKHFIANQEEKSLFGQQSEKTEIFLFNLKNDLFSQTNSIKLPPLNEIQMKKDAFSNTEYN